MRVFEQVNTTPQHLATDDQVFWETLATLGGARLNDDVWNPPPLRLHGSPAADILWLGNHALVINQRAADHLRPLLDACGELLTLTIDGAASDDTYYLFNPLFVLDALAETSEIDYFRNSDDIKAIPRPEFKPDVIAGIDIFKVTGPYSSSLYLSERYVEMATAADLVGPGYRLVWPLPPGGRLSSVAKPDYEP